MKMFKGVEAHACSKHWVIGLIVPRVNLDIVAKRITPVAGGNRTPVVYPETLTLLIEICRSCGEQTGGKG
jgi:hypothetical protein